MIIGMVMGTAPKPIWQVGGKSVDSLAKKRSGLDSSLRVVFWTVHRSVGAWDTVSDVVGGALGSPVAIAVGCAVCKQVGVLVGNALGVLVGASECSSVGVAVGGLVGDALGEPVGAADG